MYKEVSRLGFVQKILLLIAALTLTLVIGLSLLAWRVLGQTGEQVGANVHTMIGRLNHDQIHSMARLRVDALDARLDEAAQRLRQAQAYVVASLQAGRPEDAVRDDVLASSLLGEDELINAYFYLPPQGSELHFSRRRLPGGRASLPAFTDFIRAQAVGAEEGVWTAPYADVLGKPQRRALYFVQPVLVRGQLRGWLGAALPIPFLLEGGLAEVLPGSYALLVNAEGRILLPSAVGRAELGLGPIRADQPPEIPASPVLAPVIAAMKAGVSDIGLLRLPAGERYVAHEPLSSIPWRFGLIMPNHEVRRAQSAVELTLTRGREVTLAALASGAIVLCAAVLVLGYLLAHRLVQPLKDMAAVAGRLAAGSLGQRVEVPPGGEMGELGEAFNRMAASIAEHIAELRQSESRLGAVLDNAQCVITVKDRDGYYLLANRYFASLLNLPLERLAGTSDTDLLAAATVQVVRPMDDAVWRSGRRRDDEEEWEVNGQRITLLTSRFLLFDPSNNHPYALCTVAIDITRRKQAELALKATNAHLDRMVAVRTAALEESKQELEREVEQRRQALTKLAESEARYQLVVHAAGDGVFIAQDGRLTFANPALAHMLEVSLDALPGRELTDFLAPDERDRLQALPLCEGPDSAPAVRELVLFTAAGGRREVEVSLGPTTLQGAPAVVGVVRNIALRKRHERALQQLNTQLERMAYSDALTGLHNRRYFMDRLASEFARSRRYGTPMAVLMVDVDHFKRVNDSQGHAVGDLVLQHVATLFQHRTRAADIVARYGGEEFVLLLPETGREPAVALAESLRALIAEQACPLADGGTVPVTVSIGVAALPAPGLDSITTLLENADQALYEAKGGGRNQVRVVA